MLSLETWGYRPIFVETHASTETEFRACWLESECWWSFVSASRQPAQPIRLAGRALSSGRYPVRSSVFYGTSRGILSVNSLWWFDIAVRPPLPIMTAALSNTGSAQRAAR
jgi:hypothetical protein